MRGQWTLIPHGIELSLGSAEALDRYDPLDFLDRLAMDRVVQLHVVGAERSGDSWIDSHATPISDEIWALLEAVTERATVKGIIVERDENLPQFDELAAELERARQCLRVHAS